MVLIINKKGVNNHKKINFYPTTHLFLATCIKHVNTLLNTCWSNAVLPNLYPHCLGVLWKCCNQLSDSKTSRPIFYDWINFIHMRTIKRQRNLNAVGLSKWLHNSFPFRSYKMLLNGMAFIEIWWFLFIIYYYFFWNNNRCHK